MHWTSNLEGENASIAPRTWNSGDRGPWTLLDPSNVPPSLAAEITSGDQISTSCACASSQFQLGHQFIELSRRPPTAARGPRSNLRRSSPLRTLERAGEFPLNTVACR